MIRRIRELLYEQGFTINGARNRLQEVLQADGLAPRPPGIIAESDDASTGDASAVDVQGVSSDRIASLTQAVNVESLRRELTEIRELLRLGGPISQL